MSLKYGTNGACGPIKHSSTEDFVYQLSLFKHLRRPKSTVLFSFFFIRGGSGGLNVKTQPESRCPELLANFCDMLLRKTPYSKKLTSDEIQAKLKDVVSLFLCCDKDW